MPVGWLAFGITASTAFSRAGEIHIYSCHVAALLRSRKTWCLLTHRQLYCRRIIIFHAIQLFIFTLITFKLCKWRASSFFPLLRSKNYHVNYIWACHMSACVRSFSRTHQKCIEAHHSIYDWVWRTPAEVGLEFVTNPLRIHWTRKHPTKWKIKK